MTDIGITAADRQRATQIQSDRNMDRGENAPDSHRPAWTAVSMPGKHGEYVPAGPAARCHWPEQQHATQGAIQSCARRGFLIRGSEGECGGRAGPDNKNRRKPTGGQP